MSSCSLYKGAQLLGTGNITNGSTSITGWTARWACRRSRVALYG